MPTTRAETRPDPRNGAPATADRRCDHCGAAIETGDWFPVAKRRTRDGSLALFSFDREACQGAWLADDGAESPVAVE